MAETISVVNKAQDKVISGKLSPYGRNSFFHQTLGDSSARTGAHIYKQPLLFESLLLRKTYITWYLT